MPTAGQLSADTTSQIAAQSADPPPTPTGLLANLARLPTSRRGKWVVLAAWIIATIALSPIAGKLAGAQQNELAEWLPASSESTQVFHLSERFGNSDEVPAVLVYERTGGITDTDRAAVTAAVARLRTVRQVIVDKIGNPVLSRDHDALMVLVPLQRDSGGWDHLADVVREIKQVTSDRPDGLTMHLTGQAGYSAEFGAAFKGIDGTLLYAAGAVVIIVLILTYGPILWILPLVAAAAALVVAQAAVFGASGHGVTVNALSSAVLLVLVFGAGTDYALFLVSRYREELRRYPDRHRAMAVALHRAGPAVLASGGTVMVAMLALLAADMKSTRGLGPVCVIGVAVALPAMLTLLPALLVIGGRWMFWPRRPRIEHTDITGVRLWDRVGTMVTGRARLVWLLTCAALAVLALGSTSLTAGGIENRDAFIGSVDPVVGEQVMQHHFGNGGGSPVRVIVQSDHANAVAEAIRAIPGVQPETVAAVAESGDLTSMTVALTDAPTSQAAADTVARIRTVVHSVEGARALVGGDTAVRADIVHASQQDRRLLVPLILAIVMLILMVLLRSVLAPVLLTATVVLSYFAALGIGEWLFRLLGFHGEGPNMPLLAFVFLVALGIDYNIFLMSRVREESIRAGTRRGVLSGLAATGGVITSAGLVLAGTFAVLALMKLVEWAELGLVISVGVLLDTLVVRSILVTALTFDLGDRIWWPNRLSGPIVPVEGS